MKTLLNHLEQKIRGGYIMEELIERNISISPRNENIRENSNINVVEFSVNEIKEHFYESIEAIKEQFSSTDINCDNEIFKNILRAQVVFLESAFDFFLHEITKYGVCKIFCGEWEDTQKYRNIQVDMKTVKEALEMRDDTIWFRNFINYLYEKDTLVSYESFKSQLNLIGIKIDEISKKVFYDRNSNIKPNERCKQRLNELYNRRNIIAHQFDRNHINAEKKDISRETVESFIEDIEKIVEAVCEEILEYENFQR